MLDKLQRTNVNCHMGHCILCIVELRSDDLVRSVMILPIMAGGEPNEFGLRIQLEALGGCQISTERGNCGGGSAVHLMLSDG